MRLGLRFLAIAAVLTSAGSAAAGELQLSADRPLDGLPAVSSDGGTFARPVRVQPKGCAGEQLLVQLGSVGGPSDDGKAEMLVVKDDCAKGAMVAEKNLKRINEVLRSDRFRSVGKAEARSLPTDLDTADGIVKVSASGKKVLVAIAGSQTDKWTITVAGQVSEVRGWYTGKAGSARYVAIRVAVNSKETGEKGREQWIDFWPTSGTGTEEGSPVDVATRFMAALKKQDVTGLTELLSTPFWKVGLTPTGKRAKQCKSKQSAKRQEQLRPVAICMVGASRMYKTFDDADAIAEIDLRELPDELRKHKKKVQKLVRDGHKLVRYHVNDQGFYVFVVFLLDPDTDFQTVNAVLESVDVDE